MRTPQQIMKEALNMRHQAMKAMRPIRGHFFVTLDEFISLGTTYGFALMEEKRIAGYPIGVIPNDWHPELSNSPTL